MGIRKGRAVKIPVTLGLLGNTATEIKTGLLEGDVAIPVASTVVVGQRVRAQGL
jgi:HlyD family secretion protein